MDDLLQQKIKIWEKKLDEAKAFLAEALKKKSDSMSVGYLSENAYKIAAEEIDLAQTRIQEINNILIKLQKTKNS
jgi:putative sterol carrier protein